MPNLAFCFEKGIHYTPFFQHFQPQHMFFSHLKHQWLGGPRVSLVLGGGHPASRQVGFMFLGSPRSQQEALQPFCSHAAVGG